MLYKSYIVEKIFLYTKFKINSLLRRKYGLKNFFKKKIKEFLENFFINFTQDEIINNQELS